MSFNYVEPKFTRWFSFRDCHTAGVVKIDGAETIWVQARTESAAADRFERVTGRDPYYTACECCAPCDYMIWDDEVVDEPRSGWKIWLDDSTNLNIR